MFKKLKIGKLKKTNKIEEKFMTIVQMRNRIIHGFRVSSLDNEKIIATKVKDTYEQFYITEK